MTVQEVKKLLRARIQQELGSVPNALYERLWQVRERNLCELAEEDVCEADILEGDVGTDYVDAMRLMKEGFQEGQQSASAPACRVPLRASTPPVGDVIERMWSVLPERDKQAMEQVWQFAYNALEPHAQAFRERFTQGRTLTQSEAYEWITAKENGCRDVLDESPYEEYELYVVQGDCLCENVFTALLDGRDVTVAVSPESPLAGLALFVSINELFMGLTQQVIMRFVLTGEKLPPRIPVVLHTDFFSLIFPDYLSVEGVEKAWRAFHYTGNARSWILARYRLNEFSSYEEARRVWNEVAPAEWHIANYRAFQVLWTRAGGGCRENEKPKATRLFSNEWAGAFADAVDCFGVFPFLFLLSEEAGTPEE